MPRRDADACRGFPIRHNLLFIHGFAVERESVPKIFIPTQGGLRRQIHQIQF